MTHPEELYTDVASVRAAFLANKITAREAATLLGDGKIKKPWHTKEWRVLRACQAPNILNTPLT